jgi:hypothetical protein
MWFFPSQWQATIYPLLLTALLYLGPLVMAAFDCFTQCAQPYSEAEASGWSVNSLANLVENINTLVSNILAWRNYVVVSASFVITIKFLFFSPLSTLLSCPFHLLLFIVSSGDEMTSFPSSCPNSSL